MASIVDVLNLLGNKKMDISSWGKCCGAGVIHHMGGSENLDDYEEPSITKFRESFDIATKSYDGYRYSIISVVINTKQKAYYEKVLEELEFELITSRTNPKSGNKIWVYIWRRPDKKTKAAE